MCNTPVTLGGGITTVNAGRPSGLLLKYRWLSQCLYHLSSIALGSKFLVNSIFYIRCYNWMAKVQKRREDLSSIRGQ
jgi:hypothetical protein